MTRRSRLWRVGASLFAVINLVGAGMAVAQGEAVHTAVHLALLLGAYLAWRLVARARRRQESLSLHAAVERLDRLQQSIDAIAVEVERIGEAQRFMVKLQQQRAETHR
jgi:hypothetical protein